jgi:hypothetical protein
VDREAPLELGGAVDLARDQERAVEKEGGLLLLDDLEARPLEGAPARSWQLDRVAPGQGQPPAAPELGVDEDGNLRPTQLAYETVHPGRVIPVTVAQHDDVDVARG